MGETLEEETTSVQQGWSLPAWRITIKRNSLPATAEETLMVGAPDIPAAVAVVEVAYSVVEILRVERCGEVLLP